MVDKHDKHAENSDIIIVVNVGWAKGIIPRSMVQEAAKIQQMHGAQLGISEGIGQNVVGKSWVVGSYELAYSLSFVISKQRQGKGDGFCM